MEPQLHQPLPRRPHPNFELTTASPSSGSSNPPTPNDAQAEQQNTSQMPALLSKSGNASKVSLNLKDGQNQDSPSRTRSVLNLTSSTLLGIYSPTGYEPSREEPSTPWGTGAETPARRPSEQQHRRPSQQIGTQLPDPSDARWSVLSKGKASSSSSLPAERHESSIRRASAAHHHRPSLRRLSSHSATNPLARLRNFYIPLFLRSFALFFFGLAYGLIVSHLHDSRTLAPVKVEAIDRGSWSYLAFWGCAGVALGSALPWVDRIWKGRDGEEEALCDEKAHSVGDGGAGNESDEMGTGADWNPVVRSIGAFIGVAFAIRKLPWQSTLQVSLTLALVNPFIWYLIDRTRPGFLLSGLISLTGTLTLLGINPDIVPPPTMPTPSLTHLSTTTGAPESNETAAVGVGNAADIVVAPLPAWIGALVSNESIGVATWIASVLFCSCVCFGNIGRRLALKSVRL